MLTKTPTEVWITRRKGKRGVSYRLRWVNPRTGKWESLACGRDQKLAQQEKDRIRAELRDGLSGKVPETAIDAFIEQLPRLMAGRSVHTVSKTVRSVKLLEELCKVGCLSAIDRGCIMSFRSKRLDSGATPATVNKDLRQIRSALSYAADAGLLRENPLLRWRKLMLRVADKVVRIVEEDEFSTLLDGCDNGAMRALLTVAYRQGLRRQELCNLRWSAVDLDRGILHVLNVAEEGELTKSRKNRSLPLHPLAAAVLADLWQGAPKVLRTARFALGRLTCSRGPTASSSRPTGLRTSSAGSSRRLEWLTAHCTTCGGVSAQLLSGLASISTP